VRPRRGRPARARPKISPERTIDVARVGKIQKTNGEMPEVCTVTGTAKPEPKPRLTVVGVVTKAEPPKSLLTKRFISRLGA
jgi:hypothetical protein